MPDLLVPLYRLECLEIPHGYWIGRPLPHQSSTVLDFIQAQFGMSWRSEASVAFSRIPVSIELAVLGKSGDIHGFCCWDCTAKGFLGPVGVTGSARGKGVGRALVLSTLHRMKEAGYGYAIVGGAGPVDFFRSVCDARVITGSEPGIYGNPIRNSIEDRES